MKHLVISNPKIFSPDHFATLLQKCLKAKSLTPCKQIHALILTSGVNMNSLSLHSKLLGAYASYGDLSSAQLMFQITQNLNVFAYNWMISAFTSNGHFKEAIRYFSLLHNSRNLVPNSYTFSFVLKGCVGLRDLNKGKEIHCLINKYRFELDVPVVNALIDMYCKCDCLFYAHQLFDKMPKPDVISWTNMISAYSAIGKLEESHLLFEKMKLSGLKPNEFTWNSLIAGYAKIGDCDNAFKLFSKMSQTGLVPDVVTWNAMISGFVQSHRCTEALDMFRSMLTFGVKPNPVSVTGLLPVCGLTGSIRIGREIHGLIYRMCLFMNVFIASSLIDMYSKCGYLKNARNVFDKMPIKNVASWNAMIACYGKHGMVGSAIELFDMMEGEKVEPNEVTVTCVLSSCSHGGLVEKGLMVYKSMRESHGVKIMEEHYACVVDLLCRSGRMEEAYKLVREIRAKLTDSIIGAFFNGCVVHDRLDLAKELAKDGLKLEFKSPANFVTLSNVYAVEGEWEKVENVREVMKLHGVHKELGLSSLKNNPST